MASWIPIYTDMFQMQDRHGESPELTGISREQNNRTDYIAAGSGASVVSLFPSPLVPS